MELFTRRGFVRGAAGMAAAVAVLPWRSDYREHPATLKMLFFGNEPSEIKAKLFSDSGRGIFGIRICNSKLDEVAVVHFPLPEVKKAAGAPEGSKTACTATVVDEEGKRTGEMVLMSHFRPGQLGLWCDDSSDRTGIWVGLDDVRRVL